VGKLWIRLDRPNVVLGRAGLGDALGHRRIGSRAIATKSSARYASE
jgi:hypothetical protein